MGFYHCHKQRHYMFSKLKVQTFKFIFLCVVISFLSASGIVWGKHSHWDEWKDILSSNLPSVGTDKQNPGSLHWFTISQTDSHLVKHFCVQSELKRDPCCNMNAAVFCQKKTAVTMKNLGATVSHSMKAQFVHSFARIRINSRWVIICKCVF